MSNIEAAKLDYQQESATLVGEMVEIPECVKLQSFKDIAGNMFQLVQLLYS